MIRVAIIEDNANNAVTAKLQLDSSGIVRVIGMWISGESFNTWLEQSRQLCIDVILLDIRLGNHSQRVQQGDVWITSFRKHPYLQNVKFVAWTANIAPESVQAYKSKGFDGCIGKPYDPHTFAQAIKQIYGGSQIWMTSY